VTHRLALVRVTAGFRALTGSKVIDGHEVIKVVVAAWEGR